jgi:DNA-binding NarL/FixJ family response regulator
MSKKSIIIICECKYSYVGISVLLKKHFSQGNIRLFPDVSHCETKGTKFINHDIVIIFTSQNLTQSLNVVESLASLYRQYNTLPRILMFHDDARLVKLLLIMGISLELVPARTPLCFLQEKIQRLLENEELGRIKVKKKRELSTAERGVIFNLLRGDGVQHIAEKRGTTPKTIFSQKYSAMKKLRLRSISTIFTLGKKGS